MTAFHRPRYQPPLAGVESLSEVQHYQLVLAQNRLQQNLPQPLKNHNLQVNRQEVHPVFELVVFDLPLWWHLKENGPTDRLYIDEMYKV